MDVHNTSSPTSNGSSTPPPSSSATTRCHRRAGLSDRVHGDQFHIFVVMLLLFRARNTDCRYEVALEYADAGLFDDIFIRHFNEEDGQVETYMQLYHNKVCKKIPYYELLPDKKKKGKFDLRRYLAAYINYMKTCDKTTSVKRQFVIYTNSDFEYEGDTKQEDIFDEVTPSFPHIYFKSILKFKSNFAGKEVLKNKLMENGATEGEVDNFLKDFGLALGQMNFHDVKDLLRTEMLNSYEVKEFETENIFSRFYRHVTDWMSNEDGYFFNNLDVENFFTDAEREMRDNVYFNISTPTSLFHARKDEPAKLHSALLDGSNQFVIKVAVTGLPGVGKTELLLSYIKQYSTSYNNIIWINAESNNTLQQSFHDIGERLGILNSKIDNSMKLQVLLDKIYKKLSKQKCLLVFDNAVFYESNKCGEGIKQYLPQASIDTRNLNIAVTSQLTKWPCRENIQLDVFTDEEAIQFLSTNLISENVIDCHTLASMLGNLPLGLHLAIAYIKGQQEVMEFYQKEYKITEFIEEYNNNTMDILTVPISECETFSEYKKPLSQIWNLALVSVYNMPSGPLAIQALCYMSYLEPVQVPVKLLQNICNETKQNEFAKALVLLTKFSLIKHANGQLQIHRLLRDITQVYCNSSQSLGSSIRYPNETEILENMLQYFTQHYTNNDQEHFHFNSGHLLHVMKVWDTSCNFIDLYKKNCIFASKILHDLAKTSNYDLAATFIAGQQQYFKKYLLMNTIEYYSFLIENSGYLKRIKKLHEAFEILNGCSGDKGVIADITKSFPESKLLMGDALYIKASILQTMGNYQEYIQVNKIVLDIFTEVVGTHHRKTLLARHNLALSMQRMGKMNEALQTFLNVSELRTKALGENHFEDLYTKERIAFIYSQQGKYELAFATQDEIIKTKTIMFGENHQSLVISMHNKAFFLVECELYDEAIALLNKVQEIRCTVYGKDNPHGYGSDGRIAFALHKLGQNEKAHTLIKKVIAGRLTTYQEFHYKTLRDQCTLAMILASKGSIESSIHLFNKILDKNILSKIPEHALIFTVLFEFSVVLINLKYYSEALEILKPLHASQVKKLGEEHPRTKMAFKCISCLSAKL